MPRTKKTRGAQTGNLNQIVNGKRIRRKRLVVGDIPIISVRNEARKYRRNLEDAVEATREISLTDAHAIDTAAACTAHAGVCRWLLRERLKDMDTSDILACSKALIHAKQSRDLAVRTLDLDRLPEPVALSDYVVENKGASR